MIQFAYPLSALLLAPWLGLLVWSLVFRRRANRVLRALGEERVQWFVLGRLRLQRQASKTMLLFAGLGLLIIAATGPKVGTRVVQLEQQGADVLLLLDISLSMDATDVRPSRLEKAKYEMGLLISRLEGDRVGLIVFAGSAHLHCPLTSDYAAVRLFLNAVDTRLVALQGTVIGEALELAVRTFDAESRKYKAVVVLSDGEDHDGRALEAAREAASQGIIIHTVGIGSPSGAPIPVGDGTEFKKDGAGRVVTSILNELVLEELAQAGNGTYQRVDNRSGSVAALAEEIGAMEKRTLKSQQFTQFEDRYQYFVFPALLCLVAELLLPGGRRKAPRVRSRYA